MDTSILAQHARGNWVRLQTLLTLRWCAIAGQMVAVAAATQVYDLSLNMLPVVMVIAASILANLATHARYPEARRLSEREARSMMAFDIVQLALLLYLTGGLTNPFAVLILAPVVIAATVLHLGSFIALGALAIAAVCMLGLFWIPLELTDGTQLTPPHLFHFGTWVSLVIGVLFLGIYARRVTTEMHSMGDALLATQLALERERKLTDLGGVVAAAAHELGTPLATIKLVSSELASDLPEGSDSQEDARLIGQQADRCRDILHSMGRVGKDDLMVKSAPIEAVVREAAEPHLDRAAEVIFEIAPEPGSAAQPHIPRRPEIIHGLRNLIQNAVDFSQSQVTIRVRWGEGRASVEIVDDGHGFPQSVIGRIGDPYVRRRREALDGDIRPSYSGMGLGLFIAKTLLERTGAGLTFANNPESGAVVRVVWTLSQLMDTPRTSDRLGQNPTFLP
ncbi:ActS/PrrB/RegB family redox-sensitive histidine kinase [Salipiger sp. IMCC34102]|uniref:sensor histidine kinase RegB n=1 Tax=Salipiger sp. IMCC34102 TaxID=2510647 RepID=UPI00101BBF1A|nr:ActS/PrrB/RegB family redox-sensitive histidine kinase [Salipiger sp. IMCC34102]RYH04237.1 ActS/PrrB/RegB family redox-sensitive histidine kinase [Salipiger sp. IMCC34102]